MYVYIYITNFAIKTRSATVLHKNWRNSLNREPENFMLNSVESERLWSERKKKRSRCVYSLVFTHYTMIFEAIRVEKAERTDNRTPLSAVASHETLQIHF